jgi:hypothetical protein
MTLEARGMHSSVQCVESTSWQLLDGGPCGCITHPHHTQNPYLTHNAIVKIMKWELVFWKQRNLSGMILEFLPIYISAHTTLLPSLVSYPKI